jgi:hypothetical protein
MVVKNTIVIRKLDGNSLRNDPDDPLGEAFDGLKSGPEIRSPIFIARPLH